MISSITSIWTVIHRELRVESRRPFNYWLRTGAIVVLLLGAIAVAIDNNGLGAGAGSELFGVIHGCLVVGIWVLVPILAADAISKEVREGTLGLLLMTGLTAHGIVIGKSLLHTVRACTFLLAAVPMLGVCFLLGGVTISQAVVSVMVQLSMLFLALAASLLASTRRREWLSSFAWAMGFNAAFVMLAGALILMLIHFKFSPLPLDEWPRVPFYVVLSVWYFLLGKDAWTAIPMGPTDLYSWVLAFCGLILLFAIFNSARFVRQMATGGTRSPAAERVHRTLYTPRVFTGMLHRWNQRLLDRNPVAWLQQRLHQARAAKWFLGLIALVVLLISSGWDGFASKYDDDTKIGAMVILGAMIAFSSATSFRGDRESGSLELLLVTPLTDERILKGRLLGIYWVFLPATLITGGLFLAVDCVVSIAVERSMYFHGMAALFAVFAGNLLLVPLVGIFCSFRWKTFLGAWLATCVFALVNGIGEILIARGAMSIGVPYELPWQEIHFYRVPLLLAGMGMLVWNMFLFNLLWLRLNRHQRLRKFATAV